MTTDTTHPHRRRLQFTSRSLLLVMLTVASCFAGRVSMTGALRRARQSALQQREIAEWERRRAEVGHQRMAEQLRLQAQLAAVGTPAEPATSDAFQGERPN